jgi:hypothetical protein
VQEDVVTQAGRIPLRGPGQDDPDRLLDAGLSGREPPEVHECAAPLEQHMRHVEALRPQVLPEELQGAPVRVQRRRRAARVTQPPCPGEERAGVAYQARL